MMLPDVNVLLYAFRQDAPFHRESRAWLDHAVSAPERFAISRVSLSAVVRIATNQRAFRQPSTLEDAFGYCRDIVDQPNCTLIEPGERHWDIFERVSIEAHIRGPRVTDAWYAALAIEWGCEWITFDRDFARFPGLQWRLPA